jgi:hypothetical protein
VGVIGGAEYYKQSMEQKILQAQHSVPIEEYRKLVRENAELREKEVKYVDTIRHLKN